MPKNEESISLVYITVRDRAEAERIGNILLKEKLVACTNIVGDIRSMFEWDGKLNSCNEALLLAKTRTSLFEKIVPFVEKIHSSDCPCILAVGVPKANKKYLNWVFEQTSRA